MKTVLSVLAMSMAFSAFAQTTPQARDAAEIAKLNKQVQTLAKKDLSCTFPSDCQVISVGSRACGGPNGYVITSVNNKDLTKVETLAQTVTKKEAAYNAKYQVFSICSMESAPNPDCINDLCK
jgi:hypothetical protein